MLIFCGTLTGCHISAVYKRRLILHEKILRMYNETAILLEFSLMTFAEIVAHLRESGEYDEFSFLVKDTGVVDIRQAVLDGIDSWEECIEQGAINDIRCFFTKLGTTDIQGQLSYVRLAVLQQQGHIDALAPVYNRKSRFARTFGTLGGAFAAIMMI